MPTPRFTDLRVGNFYAQLDLTVSLLQNIRNTLERVTIGMLGSVAHNQNRLA